MAMSLGCLWNTFVLGDPVSSKSSQSLRLAFPLTTGNVRTVCFATTAVASSSSPKPTETKRQPRGISQPKPISPAMQEILGVPEIPRAQALKQIWAYHMKENNLQDPENKKIIVCDEKLKKIFAGKERVGFLEISGLLNPHFIK